MRRLLLPGLVLGAILTHLASEFFGMGADADAGIVLSPRHAYLALIGCACALYLILEIRSMFAAASSALDLRRRLSMDRCELPLRGDWRFYAICAIVQFGLGVGSAVGEGCFFCGHDVFFGITGALLTALLLALVGRTITARLPRLAAALCARLRPVNPSEHALRPDRVTYLSPRAVFWSPQLANRPPPVHS
ncbi:MAG TPA: hypothetical protein VEJ41_08515 [Candidatus Acidoferrales bacterium]|nr:hypothetical protein [Candidatus Acidoferrales bacterium]